MGNVFDAAPLFLGRDLVGEIPRHLLEFADHRLDLGDLATLFVDLETLEPDQTFARLHDGLTP